MLVFFTSPRVPPTTYHLIGDRGPTPGYRSRQRRLVERHLPAVGVQLRQHAERHGDRVVAVAEPEVGEYGHAEVAQNVGDDRFGGFALRPGSEHDPGGA